MSQRRSDRAVRASLAVLPLALSSAIAWAQQAPSTQKLYCWNERGTRVCSDSLPPEQAGAARTELSAQSGRQVGEVQRALTAEERAAAASAEGQARAAADSQAARIRRDLAMVAVYASEADLRRAFGERIVLVDESIKTSLMSEANLRRGLVALLQQASNLELTGKPVGKALHDEIQQRHSDLTRQLQILADQRLDRTQLDAELEGAVSRYRDLKGGGASNAASDSAPAASAGEGAA